jgi:hypothetical protein
MGLSGSVVDAYGSLLEGLHRSEKFKSEAPRTLKGPHACVRIRSCQDSDTVENHYFQKETYTSYAPSPVRPREAPTFKAR